jgi:hypothetical protein
MQTDEYNYDGLVDALNDLLDEINNLREIVHVAKQGINVTQALPNAAKVLMFVDGEN